MQRKDFDSLIVPWLSLAHAQGIGALSVAHLIEHFGSAQRVLSASFQELQELLRSKNKARSLLDAPIYQRAYFERVWSWLEQSRTDLDSRAVITYADERYPKDLREIPDPPPVLYATGAKRWLSQDDSNLKSYPWHAVPKAKLAIVGSRSPTPQGLQTARQFAELLQAAGVCIVSGMAHGIDAAAHNGALQHNNSSLPVTVAIVGTGIDRVYPAVHHELAKKIAESGLLLTEQPLGAPPLSSNFPRRNRIITGMCHALLVVEAAEKSGSLISARMAMEQGRDVMAIPGSVYSSLSRGCHALIKQGALLVENVQDILSELPLRDVSTDSAAVCLSNNLLTHGSEGTQSSDAAALLEALGCDPVCLENLSERTGQNTPKIQALLLELEMQDLVARLPGGWYQRIHGI